MKQLIQRIIPLVLVLGILTQCDSSMTSMQNNGENEEVQLIAPINSATNQSVHTELQWSKIKGAKEYKIRVSESEDFSSAIIDETVTGTSFATSSLSPETTYYWKVLPVKNNRSGNWSVVWRFSTSTIDAEPVIVTLLSPEDGAELQPDELEFNWEPAENAVKYRFQAAVGSDFTNPAVDSVTESSSITIEELDSGEEYSWRVSPVLENAAGAWSETRSFVIADEISDNPPPSSGEFVEVHNSNFVVNGEVIRFAGTNAYYLPNYEKIGPGVVDRAFDLFEETGVNVIRMWGFYDGFDCGYSKNDSNENVIQTAPGEYSESALRDMDSVIAKGKERGIKFIIPFINYWDELGGICQYNTWAGASNPGRNMEFFMSNEQTQQWFRDYIEMLLNRVNTVTGVKYKDEPAIFAWQIMNEGRNGGGDPRVLRDWYQEIAQFIKSIDSNHLVGTGEEGFDEGTPSEYTLEDYSNLYVLRAQAGTSYIMNTSIPEIDFGSAHWYPNEWGFGTTINDQLLRAQRAWLSDHQRIAESHGKPFIMGEFGFPGWADGRVQQMYDELYNYAESIDLDGNLLWQLVADGEKCWEFGGNICYPGGRTDTELYNRFKQHIDNMKKLK